MASTCTVAVVSDTHGCLDPRVMNVVKECDYAVHAGDIGGASVLAALCPKSGEVFAVLGNNDTADKWAARERNRLQTLKSVAEVELPGGTLVVIHGDCVLPARERHSRLRSLFPAARAIVYGHSHRLREDCSELPWVLNPGAAGRSRTFGGPSCMILHANARRWRVQSLRFPQLPPTMGRRSASATDAAR